MSATYVYLRVRVAVGWYGVKCNLAVVNAIFVCRGYVSGQEKIRGAGHVVNNSMAGDCFYCC